MLNDIDILCCGCRKLLEPVKENMDPNLLPVKQMKGLLSSSVAKGLIEEKKFKTIKRNVVEDFICNNQVDATIIQEALDVSGVSKKGYSSIFHAISSTLKDQRIKRVLLPNPATVWRIRGHLNDSIDEFIGQYIHIEEIFPGGKGTTVYDPWNNIFVDLQQLQRRMVEFYGLTFEECKGILKFVIKLDECEVVKEKKMERVTITLMNGALDTSLTEASSKYFSVQSEKHIWWLGSFQV